MKQILLINDVVGYGKVGRLVKIQNTIDERRFPLIRGESKDEGGLGD